MIFLIFVLVLYIDQGGKSPSLRVFRLSREVGDVVPERQALWWPWHNPVGAALPEWCYR
jgi:hypothetical protein